MGSIACPQSKHSHTHSHLHSVRLTMETEQSLSIRPLHWVHSIAPSPVANGLSISHGESVEEA